MKKALILAVVALLIAVPAMAEDTGRGVYTTPCPPLTEWLNTNEDFYHTHPIPEVEDPRLTLGAEIDAPNLVRFSKNWTLGMRAGKEMYNDPFMDRGGWVEDDEGYFAYIKVTYRGTWFDFSK